ncbi:MAG TPA: sulfurtransferase TusA family protein [Planctomycetota bacterium]
MNLPDDDPDLLPAATLAERTAALQRTVQQLEHTACPGCGHALCGHEAVLAVVFGYKNAPRCAVCIAAELRESEQSLCERALQWIRRRDCFLHVWQQAGEREIGGGPSPRCRFASGDLAAAATPPGVAPAAPIAPAVPAAAATFDAGDLGCGDLVLELRLRLREQAPGAVLHVTARDPAAPVDLPAWCGLCGHTLLRASHPHYWIQRKRD